MSESFEQMANRFGLQVDGGANLIRHGSVARFSGIPDLTTEAGRHEAFCQCLGTRLGLDLRAGHMPKGVGDLEWRQRVVPRSVRLLAQQISGRELQSRPWLDRISLELVFTRESGKLLLAASSDDHVDNDDARRALFFAAYKLRPVDTTALGSGKLLHYQTTGGLASSVASLLPDFDLDTARERGVFAIPGYDRLLVFRAPAVDSALRRITRQAVADAPRPMSRRLYSLRRDRIIPAEVCGPTRDFDAANLEHNLIEVVT